MQRQRLVIIRNLLSLHSLALQLPKCPKNVAGCLQQQQQQQQTLNFSLRSCLTQAATTTISADEQKAKKAQQKITLIAQNQAMSITTLEEAQKLAKRRDLHLLRLKESDPKSGRVMFKLVTAAEILADDLELKDTAKSSSADRGSSSKKSEKSLSIGARITEHDLASRLKNIAKWLHKQHEVRILIQCSGSGTDEGNAERIFKSIESAVKQPQVIGKIVQRRQKGAFIKFSILPVAAPTNATATTTIATPPSSASQS